MQLSVVRLERRFESCLGKMEGKDLIHKGSFMGVVKCLNRLTSSNSFACGILCATNSTFMNHIFIKNPQSFICNKYLNPITLEQI